MLAEIGNMKSLSEDLSFEVSARRGFVKFPSGNQFKSCHRNLFMRLLLAAAPLLFFITSASAAGLVLADHGQSRYTIVIASDASATVKHAAQELSDDLKQISGAVLPVTSQKPHGPAIFVGA